MAIHYFDDPSPVEVATQKQHWYDIGTRVIFTRALESFDVLQVRVVTA